MRETEKESKKSGTSEEKVAKSKIDVKEESVEDEGNDHRSSFHIPKKRRVH